jgi:hypothetical protein
MQLFEVLDDMQKVYQERTVEAQMERENELARQLAEEVSFEDMLSACTTRTSRCGVAKALPDRLRMCQTFPTTRLRRSRRQRCARPRLFEEARRRRRHPH